MSLFQNYEKEVRSGKYSPPLHEDSKKNLSPDLKSGAAVILPPINPPKSRWDIPAILMAFALPVAGYYTGQHFSEKKEPQVITKEVIKKVSVPGKTRWRTRTVPGPVRWRVRTDPATERKFNELRAQYALRHKMLIEFYTQQLSPGESRKLTFTTDCPGVNNTMDIPTLKSYSN